MPRSPLFGAVSAEDLYRRIATGESVVLVDVRTADEFAAGHIPGSLLIPLHELEARWREIPNGGSPIAVICEHGIRSAAACQFLAEMGIGPLENLRGGIAGWTGPVTAHATRSEAHRHPVEPEPFLVESVPLLPRGLALDVAMGSGRHSVYLAARGFDVDGVDADPEAVRAARAAARRLAVPFRAVVGNVEDGTYIIPLETYDVILVFDFLHRPLFTDIREGVRAGGVVVYQSATLEQRRFDPACDPARLLRPGELAEVFRDWEILRSHERIEPGGGSRPPRALAGIVARKPSAD